jgi:hypothetical protein
MERGSDKHNPRLDEEMKHEISGLVTGAPVEPRAEEWREQEGPAEGEPTPDSRLSGDRGIPVSDELSLDAIERRTTIAQNIQGKVFPARPGELIESAREMQAPDWVVAKLTELPDGVYDHFEAVWEALGGDVEYRA